MDIVIIMMLVAANGLRISRTRSEHSERSVSTGCAG